MSVYTIQGSKVLVNKDNNLNVLTHLKKSVYVVKYDDIRHMYYLEQIEDFVYPKKLYGNILNRAQKVIETYSDRPFSTGVLLSGMPGAGKSQLAKLICLESQLPVICVNEEHFGDDFNDFLQSITDKAIIFFDELEKIYEFKNQAKLLTLFDGSFNTNKLYLVTVNEVEKLHFAFLARPGRLYYHFKYNGLDDAFIHEYVDDTLVHVDKKEEILKTLNLVGEVSFDILKSLIEEVNRYNIAPLDALNDLNILSTYKNKSYLIKKIVINGKDFTSYNEHTKLNWNPMRSDYVYYEISGDSDEDKNIYLSPSLISRLNKHEIEYKTEQACIVLSLKENDDVYTLFNRL